MNHQINIVAYGESHAAAFKALNLAWLHKYFYVEPLDEEMLSYPKHNIIDKGGYIYFAECDNKIAGTFALLKIEEGVFELSKMAVDENFQGKGIGNKILESAIENAKKLGAVKVILFSNTILQPAIHLYRKYGFKEVALGTTEYNRANIKMEIQIA